MVARLVSAASDLQQNHFYTSESDGLMYALLVEVLTSYIVEALTSFVTFSQIIVDQSICSIFDQ